MGFDYDKTRKNIAAGNLGDSEQKDLLRKFRDSGGEIIKEKADRPTGGTTGGGRGGVGGGGGRRGGAVVDTRLPSEIARDNKRKEAEKIAAQRAHEKRMEDQISGFMAKLQIKFKGLLSGVSPFGGSWLKPAAMEMLSVQTKKSLMECNLLGSDLFHSDPVIGRKITEGLDKITPLYMELLERGHRMYDSTVMNEFNNIYSSFRDQNIELKSIREPLIKLYRELYYFYPYYNTYLKAAEEAIELQSKIGKISNTLKSDKSKRIKKDVHFLFNILFPKLYIILIRTDMKLYPDGSPMLEKVLGLVDEDRINPSMLEAREVDTESLKSEGDQTKAAEESKADKNKEKDPEQLVEEQKKAEESLPKEIKYGLSLMKMYKLDQLRKKHDPRNEYYLLGWNDKVLMTYLFLQEFEFEYSFVLTTNKIKLRVDYTGGTKQDYHEKLRDQYDTLRNNTNILKTYLDSCRSIDKLKKSPGTNYVQHSKNVGAEEQKRSQAGRSFRMGVMEAIKTVSASLLFLINDMKGERKVVTNMDEPITFDVRVEGRKRLNGKKISQCIMEAYCYGQTLAGRLENGDLFGGVLEMSDEEFIRSYGKEQFEALLAEKKGAGSGEVDIPDGDAAGPAGKKPAAPTVPEPATAAKPPEALGEIAEIDEEIDMDGEIDHEL